MTALDEVRQRAEADARTYGYHLNPDPEFLQNLLEGLKQNEERYSYPSCPCRLASGRIELDRDIICPCDYRDPDVEDFGMCYCGLYTSSDIYEGKTEVRPVPERRPLEKQVRAYEPAKATQKKEVKTKIGVTAKEEEASEVKKRLWYCRQCGYVVFRDDSPYICPICKAKKEMFAEIKVRIEFSG